jgi:hypothetical protein
MDSLTERQESLNLTIPECVIVVGSGGVGSWTAIMLAMAGVKKLWVFDGDTLSENNRNRIPLPAADVGRKKSVATAAFINTLRPQCTVMALGTFDERIAGKLNLANEASWLVCTTDTLASRKMTQNWASVNNVSYIEAAAEGEIGSATGETANWNTPEESQPGYASVPVWIGPCVSAAVIAVSHILHRTPMGDRTVRIGWGKDKFEVYDSHAASIQLVPVTPLGAGYDFLGTAMELQSTSFEEEGTDQNAI